MTAVAGFDLPRYDLAGKRIADLPWNEFAEGARAGRWGAPVDALRLRYRWRLDEFAQHVMGPMLAANGTVSPPCALDDAIYGLPPHRVGHRPGPVQRLVMTGRGVGKTTRQKIRAFHGLLYGLRRLSVTIAKTDGDATGWVENITTWCLHPGDLLAELFPELAIGSSRDMRVVGTRFGSGVMVAKSWTGSARGFNLSDHKLGVSSLRPDALDLDDIESEDTSASLASRNATMFRLTRKMLPLVSRQVPEIIWTQTPVHPDAVAARVVGGHPEVPGWDVRVLPVLTQWPDRDDLWAECRRRYDDADALPDKADRYVAAEAYYLDNREAMDAGAQVLDAVGMGVFSCHVKLWDVGPSAFASEYLMSTRSAGSCFDSSTWPRHTVEAEVIVRPGRDSIPLRTCRLVAHLDTSDGGDDGALVVCAERGGVVYEVASGIWSGTKLSDQIRGVPGVLAPFVSLGLGVLQWEPPPGAASTVEAALRAALNEAGLRVDLVPRHSTERKTDRIRNTLEPLAEAKHLSIRADLDRRATSQADAFDPDRTNNTDDWLDALQRCCEQLAEPQEESLLDLLRSL